MEGASETLGIDSMTQESSWREEEQIAALGRTSLGGWKEEDDLKKWPKQIRPTLHPKTHSVVTTEL